MGRRLHGSSEYLRHFFSDSRIEGLKSIIEGRFLSSYENIIYSHKKIFLYIFINFILGHLRLRKEVNFYSLENGKKIVRPRVKFCPPTGTSSPTGTSPNWYLFELFLCHWELESPNCLYTENLFIFSEIQMMIDVCKMSRKIWFIDVVSFKTLNPDSVAVKR